MGFQEGETQTGGPGRIKAISYIRNFRMANRESQQRRIKISHVAVSHTTKALSEKLRKTFTYELVPENLSTTMVYPAGVQGRAGGRFRGGAED